MMTAGVFYEKSVIIGSCIDFASGYSGFVIPAQAGIQSERRLARYDF
jgi:hypothetical protein